MAHRPLFHHRKILPGQVHIALSQEPLIEGDLHIAFKIVASLNSRGAAREQTSLLLGTSHVSVVFSDVLRQQR
jgi:hypothetical protein